MFSNLISDFANESYSKHHKWFSSSKEIPVLRIYLLMSYTYLDTYQNSNAFFRKNHSRLPQQCFRFLFILFS